MTTTMNRRTALLGTVTLPAAMAPLGLAGAATAPNATDEAWAEYREARAAYEAHRDAERAFNATLPEHLHPLQKPDLAGDFDWNREAWEAARAEWERERAHYPANPYRMTDERLDAHCDAINAEQHAVISTPAATLEDIERKLTIFRDEDLSDEDRDLDQLLADVRRLAGRAEA